MNSFTKQIDSIVGRLTLIANDHALIAVLWEHEQKSQNDRHPILNAAEKQLSEYFSKKRTSFDLPLEFIGTEFQKKVWNALNDIPFGKTMSYGELAAKVGNPKGARAIGMAVGKNPISIIVPCHRIIGADGTLTGFGGGLEAKRILLQLEGWKSR